MTPLITVYLDQVDNDPIKACQTVAELGITHVCLRKIWTSSIGDVAPGIHDKLLAALATNKLQVAMIDSDLGGQITQAADELARVTDLCKMCQAYKCQQLLIKWGKKTRAANTKQIAVWMEAVSMQTLDWAVQPIYPLSADGAVTDPAVLAALLQQSKRWKLSYDPAGLVVGNSDHITKYWSLLRAKVWGLDVCDATPGAGRCIVGEGRGRLDVLLSMWARNSDYWLVLKPNIRQNTIIWPQFVEYLGQLRKFATQIGIPCLDLTWPDGA